jgi:RHS repeat-associated protein
VTAGNLSWTYSWVERLGQVGHIAASNGMTTTRDFDAMGRLSGITTQDKDGKIVARHGYAYDALNRRVRGEREDATRWDYGYDNLGQVTSGVRKTADGASIPGFAFQYGFDNIGNRRNATVNGRTDSYAPTLLNTYANKTNSGAFDVVGTAEQGTTLTLEGATPGAPRIPVTRLNNWFAGAAPADNASGATLGTAELLAIKKNAGPNAADVIEEETRSKVVRPAVEGFAYDLDGNLESDGLWNYGWDGENRLISLTPKTGNEELLTAKFAFGYDGESRRIWTDRTAWDTGNATWSATTQRTWFVYDGWNLLCTLDVGGSTLDVGSSLVWGPDLSGTMQGAGGIGGLIFVDFPANATLSSSPFYDGNGNVLGLLAADGQTVTARYEYGPFGEALAKTGPAADLNPFRWSTKFTDESGLVYYGYRFYNPETGRWVSRDPIGERGGMNLYGFVGNSQISRIDRLGLYDPSSPSDLVNDFINPAPPGMKNHQFGGNDLSTQEIRNHPAMQRIREEIKSEILAACLCCPSSHKGQFLYDARKENPGSAMDTSSPRFRRMLSDLVGFLTNGNAGTQSPLAAVVGSFSGSYSTQALSCKGGTATLTLVARNSMSAGSGTALADGHSVLPSNPLGPSGPLGSVSMSWSWTENLSFPSVQSCPN